MLKSYAPLTRENIADFMGDIASIEVEIGEKNAVMVTTGHGTKGNEWPVVFVACLNKGLFPNYRSVKEGFEEEELRLFYVCASRAKDIVYFTYHGTPSEYLSFV